MSTTKTKTKPKKFSVTMQINGKVLTEKSDSLEDAILAMKPDVLLTEVYVTAKKGKEMSERRLGLNEAKKMFLDDVARQVFIQNLLLN